MNNTKSLLLVGFAGLVIGLLIFPFVFRDSKMVGDKDMSNNVDRLFIEQMIPHHEGAVEMAKLALKKSKRSEIISLANGIIEAQQREIADMKKWYRDWFGVQVPNTTFHQMDADTTMVGMIHMNSMSGDMEALNNATDFDLEFIKQMIPHHEMVVMMGTMLDGTTNRSEMKVLAENIITSQTKEIEMMQSWSIVWSK